MGIEEYFYSEIDYDEELVLWGKVQASRLQKRVERVTQDSRRIEFKQGMLIDNLPVAAINDFRAGFPT